LNYAVRLAGFTDGHVVKWLREKAKEVSETAPLLKEVA
jgi:hypothetical protein